MKHVLVCVLGVWRIQGSSNDIILLTCVKEVVTP